ncbi:acyltransferase family protein [Bacillus safensis]|uniref:acyltransferase family protein n=1 Tax=Bacillus safensis TaxID=561879 RepID=UPI001CF0B251|nr:acyltransferase family protein [Bacillus safensis]MCA6608876.1 acyltransferase family protein [Bacillus safensis]
MASSRDSYFDNAKFLLIFLVVFGHLLRSFIHDNDWMLYLYKFIYTFHMPAFILVSGFFAKGFRKPGFMKKVAVKLIIPYLIFQVIYSVYYYLLQDQSMANLNPIDPQWSLWFLISLFFWNLLLIPFSKLPFHWAMIVSLSIALLVGYVDSISDTLSLSRTFVFLPMFLAGFYLKKQHFEFIRTSKGKLAALVVLMAVSLFCYFYEFDYSFLFGSKSYASLGDEGMIAAMKRMAWYLLAFGATFSFFALVPTRRFFFTKWGTRTLYVYLLHGFVIKLLRTTWFDDWALNAASVLILLLLTILLTFTLSSTFVKTVAQPVIELKMTHLMRTITGRQGSYIK